MNNLINDLKVKIEHDFNRLSYELKQKNDSLVIKTNISSNDSFILRMSLSIFKSIDGDEISISVDIKNRKNNILIDSDICNCDGSIIAECPVLFIRKEDSYISQKKQIEAWHSMFSDFISNETVVPSSLRTTAFSAKN